MIDGQARQAALALARERYTPEREDDELVLDDSRTEEKHVGWVVHAQSQHYLETDHYDSMLPATQAIFVNRLTMMAGFIDGAEPTDFEVNGSPDHDWPRLAWITVPIAVLLQASIWAVGWMFYEYIAQNLGFFVFNWLIVAALGLVLSGPIRMIVAWTEFANIRPAIPVVAVLTGAVIGDFVVSVHFVAEQVPDLQLVAAIVSVPDFYSAQSGAYFMMKLLAAIIMTGIASSVGSGHKTRRRLWRGYSV